MKKDKRKIYILEIVFAIILFLTLFEQNIVSKLLFSLILLAYMFVVKYFLKKRNYFAIHYREVMFVMIGMGVISTLVFYLSGFFSGFYEAPIKFGFWGIINYIIPFTIIIIASEIIRYIYLSQKSKPTNIFILIAMVIIDIIIYAQVYDMTNLDDFLVVLGFITFASISCNLLYNYVSSRYGYKGIIIYRLITVLPVYIIPYIPNVYILFRSVARMFYPYLIYLFLDNNFSKEHKVSEIKSRKRKLVETGVLLVVVALITMLISCQFRYGILVIGSGSMTGAINKGDAVVFESYKNEKITPGQVIIFKRGKLKIVHRVVDIQITNNEYRYITKGDANLEEDDGYVTASDILGISKFRIAYIGYPTIWVNDLFQKQ